MIKKINLPILDFDSTPTAIIQPKKNDYDFVLPSKCIAIFFKDIVDALSKMPNVKEIGRVTWETGDVIYYSYLYEGKEICFYHSWVGAPISAAVMDLTIALGVREILAIGGCGILDKRLSDDNILLPVEGVRDEGTSYHYVKPSRTISPSNELLNKIKNAFSNYNVSYKCVKTWTTDGFYRETKKRCDLRKKQGCETVDMEFTAMCAVAKLRSASFAAIFYCGDIVEFENYDERDWQCNTDLRRYLFELSKKIMIGEKQDENCSIGN